VRRIADPGGPRWRVGVDAVVEMLQALGFDDVRRIPYAESDFRKDAPPRLPPRALVVARRSAAFGQAWRIDDADATARGIRFRLAETRIVVGGTVADAATRGRPLVIEFAIEIAGGGPFAATLSLYRDGALVVTAEAGPFAAGERRITFDFGPCVLASGRYQVVLSIHDRNAPSAVRLVNVFGVALVVEEGDPAEGPTHLDTTWEAITGAVLSAPNTAANAELRVGEIALSDDNGNAQSTVGVGDPILGTFPVRGVTDPDDLVWEFFVLDANRFFVHAASSHGRIAVPHGVAAVRVRVPSLFLRPGAYLVGGRVASRGGAPGRWIDYAKATLTIRADETPSAGLVVHRSTIDPPKILDPAADASTAPFLRIDAITLAVDGAAADTVPTGAAFAATARVRLANLPRGAVLRFQILDLEDGVLLWGFNTRRAGIDLSALAPGMAAITARIERLRLLAGRYHLRVSAWDSDATEANAATCLDARTIALVVDSPPEAGNGRAALETQWNAVDTGGRAFASDAVDRTEPLAVGVQLVRDAIEPGGAVVVEVDLDGLSPARLPEVTVVVEDDRGSAIYVARMGTRGRRIVAVERRAALRLTVAALPLAPGDYRVRAVVLNHRREKAIDPARVLGVSAPVPLRVTGNADGARLRLPVVTRVTEFARPGVPR
jgi:hypothetical protein